VTRDQVVLSHRLKEFANPVHSLTPSRCGSGSDPPPQRQNAEE
jgi:hypothetical protein